MSERAIITDINCYRYGINHEVRQYDNIIHGLLELYLSFKRD